MADRTKVGGKETQGPAGLDGLAAEATRVLPLEEDAQAGQAGLNVAPPAVAPQARSPGRSLALNTMIVSGAFVISRALGLLREAVIAGQFGTGGQASAYAVAFGIPDTLFLLIIGGAVGSAFIPVFTELIGKGKEEQAWRLASTLINASVVLLSLGAIAMSFAAPALVATVIAPGNEVDQGLVVELTRILLLSPLLMGLGGWAMGILNARQHFSLPAFAPIAYNLAIIFGALVFVPLFGMGIHGVAWGVVLGAALHFGVQVPGLVRAGMRYSLRLNVGDEGVKEVGKLLLPRIVGQAAFQANIVGAKSFATTVSASSVAAFNYAYLLMILPHGVFAMSLATVTFPTMAAQYAEGNLEGLRETLSRAIRVLVFLTLPSAVGMFVLRSEIVATLLQFGAFNAQSTRLVASALGYFALGLVAYSVVEVLTRAFYALHDTATPVGVAVLTVAMNLSLSGLLVFGLGWDQDGLALSLALTTTVEMVLLWLLLGRKLPGWRVSSLGLPVSVGKSALASAAMATALLLLMPALGYLLGHFLQISPNGKLGAGLLTVAGVGVGGAVYLGAAMLLRSEELGEALRVALRRRPTASDAKAQRRKGASNDS